MINPLKRMGAESDGALKAWKIHIVFRVVRTKAWKIHIVFRVVRTKAWKALLSEAVVTRDRVPGLKWHLQLSGRQYLCSTDRREDTIKLMSTADYRQYANNNSTLDMSDTWRTHSEVLPSRQLISIDFPRALPSVTTASLSKAFQALSTPPDSDTKVFINYMWKNYSHLFDENVYFLFIALKRMGTF